MSEEQQAIRKREEAIVNKACSDLGEHFDNVRIFVSTKNEEANSTRYQTVGYGSYFAQYGQITQWLIKEDSQVAQEAVNDMEGE